VLEGGYELDALAASVAATLEALAGDAATPRSFDTDELTARAASVVKQYWPL
jgi:acetoin utilization deacetylase AcuC-like enzyme